MAAAREPYGGTRKEMNRAIRRLNVLEWVMLGAAAVVALIGGWLIAWLVRDLGLSFRLTWSLASILLFAVPGGVVLAREARSWSSRVTRGGPGPTGETPLDGGSEAGDGTEPYETEER